MEHLKHPIQINKRTADALEHMKGALGFNRKYAWFIVFQDFKIEERHIFKRRWGFLSRYERKETSYYITDFKFHIWNINRQAWTHLSEQGLMAILDDEDFVNMRRNYFTMIKAPLEFLGVKFRVNKVTSDERTSK